MLERAAGSFESARQCLLRESSCLIRSNKALGSAFWRSQALELLRLRYLVLRQPSSRQLTVGCKYNDNSTEITLPFLDFLYPPKTRPFFSSWIRERNLTTRRRQKRSVDFSRSFTSETVSTLNQNSNSANDIDERKLRLLALLENQDLSQYDEAWGLYTQLSHDYKLCSLVLQYLSKFPLKVERTRLYSVFNSIPRSERTAHDYLHMIHFLVQSEEFSEARLLCSEAITNEVGSLAWDFVLATSIKALQWDTVLDLWKVKPQNAEREWPCEALREMFSIGDLSGWIADFQSFAKNRTAITPDSSVQSFGRWLLDSWSTSPTAVKKTTTEAILSFTQASKALGCLEAHHYYQAIQTLCSFDVRWHTARSIVLYRNFRWLLDEIIPPKALLHDLLEAVAAQGITDAVQYLLDDFEMFYGKPSIEAYKKAMVTFSKTGDAPEVNNLFQKLMKDYGNSNGIPANLRWVTPLLYAHARVGDVGNTEKEFNRISEEFGMKANSVCWNILLTAFATAGDIDGMLSTLKRFLGSDQRPDSYTFGIVMGLCANRGDIDNVLELLKTANERKVKITTAMMDTLVEVFCNNQRLEKAEEIAGAAISMGLQGSHTRMWNILLWMYAYRADFPSISRIRARMDEADILPDGMTYAALMLALARIGQPDQARRLLRTMHRSRRVYATEFHYTILLYAYVKARNRDMIYVIYREIQSRFGTPGLSSQLLMLKGYLQRYVEAQTKKATPREIAKVLELAEDYLANIISNFNHRMLATKQPQPGAKNKVLKDAFPSLFYEQMMEAHNETQAYSKTVKQLKSFHDNSLIQRGSDQNPGSTPLQLITRMMSAHLGRKEYAKVEECWKSALKEASKVAKQVDFGSAFRQSQSLNETQTPPQPSSPRPLHTSQSLLVNEIPTGATMDKVQEDSKISSHRFILSSILSIYLIALGKYNRIATIPQVLERLQRNGFSLTTQNWSTYIQVLARSPRIIDQVVAFTIFEERYMPHFPGWKALRRGYAIKPEAAASTINYMDNSKGAGQPGLVGKRARRFWSKIDPDYMYPTYTTLVHLASALLKFRERSILDGGDQLRQIYSTAPRTIEALGAMPYLREKWQGVLLRNRNLEGEREVAPSEVYAWSGGMLGVGGQARLARKSFAADFQREQPSSLEMPESELNSETGLTDEAVELPDQYPQRTLAYEDEQDLETEVLLHARHRQFGIDPLFEDEPEEDY